MDMSINLAHLTDRELTQFTQPFLDEALTKAGTRSKLSAHVTSFFLHPRDLGKSQDSQSMEFLVLRRLRAILPPPVMNNLPSDAARTFLGGVDLAYRAKENFEIVLSRPDSTNTMAERIELRTGIRVSDLKIEQTRSSAGFDNLELLGRIFQILNCLPNGGLAHVQTHGGMNLIKYRSTLGAQRKFLERGGDLETVAIHAAAGCIGAFTRGKISWEYMGFMTDLGFSDRGVELAHRIVLDQLVEKGHTTSKTKAGSTLYANMSAENLLVGLAEVLDNSFNRISKNGGAKFAAFHAAVSRGEMTPKMIDSVGRMSAPELTGIISHFVAFQTMRGLKTLMGENTLKYTPERENGGFHRTAALLRSHQFG